MLTGPWADVDNPVRHPNGVLIMLDDDEGVTEISQSHKGVDEASVVTLVQADGGLIKDVENPNQTRTNLGSESNTLSLTT